MKHANMLFKAPLGLSVMLMFSLYLPQPTSAQTRYGTGLGRLLTTEQERTRIDNRRFNVVEAVKETKTYIETAPDLLLIEGLTYRPDRPEGQRVSIWINGQVYAENALPAGLRLVRNSKGEVIGLNSVVAKGKTEFAKIGDSITRPQTTSEAQAAQAAEQAQKQADKPVKKPEGKL